MKKAFVVAILAATLFGTSVTAFARGMGGFNQGFYGTARYGARCGFGQQYMQKELNLTPQQIQQIQQLRQEALRGFSKNQSNYKMPMYEAMKSGNFNKQVFIEESEQNAKMRAENRANYMERFFNILTPAQRQKFVALQKQRMQFALKNLEYRQQMIQNRINYLQSNIQ